MTSLLDRARYLNIIFHFSCSMLGRIVEVVFHIFKTFYCALFIYFTSTMNNKVMI